MSNKEINKLIRQLEKLPGWRVERGGKHFKAYPPDKNIPPVTIPTTPGENRSMKNLIAQLRRAGAPF